VVDALRHLLGDEVAGRLLHCNLALDGVGHVVAVPAYSALVVPVEEVHLGAGGPHVRMQANELKQRPRPALLHANDERVGQVSRWSEALLPEQLILGRPIQAAGHRLSRRSTGGGGAVAAAAVVVSRVTALVAGRGGEGQ